MGEEVVVVPALEGRLDWTYGYLLYYFKKTKRGHISLPCARWRTHERALNKNAWEAVEHKIQLPCYLSPFLWRIIRGRGERKVERRGGGKGRRTRRRRTRRGRRSVGGGERPHAHVQAPVHRSSHLIQQSISLSTSPSDLYNFWFRE